MTKTLLGVSALACLLFACRGSDDKNNTSDGDGGSNGDAIPAGLDAKIFDIQSDAMAVGTPVNVAGVVVTAIDNFGKRTGGIYVQEPEGGAYSGVYVFLNGTQAAGLAVGDLVDIKGAVKDEFALQDLCSEGDALTLTELSAPEGASITVTKVGVGEVPAAQEVNPWDLAADQKEAEKWEGVLIKFSNVRVLGAPRGASEADPDLKEMRVTGPYVVSSSLTGLSDTIVDNDCFASVTGIGDFFFDYKILPRTADDLVAGETDACPTAEVSEETCKDGQDNDHSGQSDCADFSCQTAVAACTLSASVEAIQKGDIAANTKVTLKNLVVTARSFNGKRFWVQDAGDAKVRGGIYVFRPGSAEVLPADIVPGTTLDLTASISEFFAGCGESLTQLTFAEISNVVAGGASPAPLTVTLPDLIAAKEDYEGVLVTIPNVTVGQIYDGLPQNLEFEVKSGTSTIVVDDDIFRVEKATSDQCLTITGVVSWNTFDNSAEGGLPQHMVLLPRAAADVTTGACN